MYLKYKKNSDITPRMLIRVELIINFLRSVQCAGTSGNRGNVSLSEYESESGDESEKRGNFSQENQNVDGKSFNWFSGLSGFVVPEIGDIQEENSCDKYRSEDSKAGSMDSDTHLLTKELGGVKLDSDKDYLGEKWEYVEESDISDNCGTGSGPESPSNRETSNGELFEMILHYPTERFPSDMEAKNLSDQDKVLERAWCDISQSVITRKNVKNITSNRSDASVQ